MLSQHYRGFACGHKGSHTISYSSIHKGLIHLTHLRDTEPIQDQLDTRIVMESNCINVQSRLHIQESKSCETITTGSFNDIQETTLSNLHLESQFISLQLKMPSNDETNSPSMGLFTLNALNCREGTEEGNLGNSLLLNLAGRKFMKENFDGLWRGKIS